MEQRRPLDLTDPVSPTDHAIGPVDADVTLVEYGDFECPNCKQAAPAVKLMLERFAGRIRLVWRHFPLEEVHPHALLAAEAAEAAGEQGKFWPMHDVLFANQARLKAKQLRGYAEHLELDLGQYSAEVEDHVYLQRVREHIDSGRRSGVRSTPTFFVNGTLQDVSYGVQALETAIEALLAQRAS
jgi:protein-disulfide isomerase